MGNAPSERFGADLAGNPWWFFEPGGYWHFIPPQYALETMPFLETISTGGIFISNHCLAASKVRTLTGL